LIHGTALKVTGESVETVSGIRPRAACIEDYMADEVGRGEEEFPYQQ
jgi:hypothetical protein